MIVIPMEHKRLKDERRHLTLTLKHERVHCQVAGMGRLYRYGETSVYYAKFNGPSLPLKGWVTELTSQLNVHVHPTISNIIKMQMIPDRQYLCLWVLKINVLEDSEAVFTAETVYRCCVRVSPPIDGLYYKVSLSFISGWSYAGFHCT